MTHFCKSYDTANKITATDVYHVAELLTCLRA